MTTTRSGFELTGNYFLPVIRLHVEYMDIIHPVDAVVPSEVDDFRIDEAPCGWDSCTWHVTADLGLHPGESLRIEIEDVIELTELVGLTSKNVNLLIKRYGTMLQAPVRSLSMGLNWSTPFETIQVQNEELVKPVFAIPSSKNEHLVVYYACRVELSHRCLSPNDVGNVEAEFVNALFEVNKDDVREHLETIPASVDDNLAAVPDLTRVAHSWLRKFMFVNFWLRPGLFL